MIRTIIQANRYMDSIFLMNATKSVMDIKGVNNAVLVMGTEMNKTVLEEFGGLTKEAAAASANDLVVSVDIADEGVLSGVNDLLNELQKGSSIAASEEEYSTLNMAAEAAADANLAIISVPGEFAGQEAKDALLKGMNVFIFSDNVPIEEEVELKKIAEERDLWVMGPGCGTAIIDNISLGVVSKVRRGNIGIVGASGSGIHEIAILVHRYGMGISQAIGTGGKDISEQVGGSTMIRGLRFLENDPETKVIVLVSKPPHPATIKKVLDEVRSCSKPVVIFFLGGDPSDITGAGAVCASSLEDAAEIAVALAKGVSDNSGNYLEKCESELKTLADAEKKKLKPEQKYLRAIFCGGTHSEESVLLLQDGVADLHSNLAFGKAQKLANSNDSIKNTLVDMGDEEFTRGKPHPVMDPSILNGRLMQDGSDPEVGVILFDLLYGHGIHRDPVGTIEDTIRAIRKKSEDEGRYISFIASLCGTDLDIQNIEDQQKRLEELGVIIMPSNAKASILSSLIISKGA